jgi:signal transduction histidine kinase
LLSNSIKYSHEGGKIEVIISTNKNEVLIRIKDQGIGISEENKYGIFDRFEKVDKRMNRENEGSGIGLYIAKALVEILNGIIWVKSNLGEGSCFFVKFPILDICEKICAAVEESNNNQNSNIVEKINIEFSDIYFK